MQTEIRALKAALNGAENLPEGITDAIAALESTAQRFSGIDPEQYQSAMQQLQQRQQQDNDLTTARQRATDLEAELSEAQGTIQNLQKGNAAARGLMSAGVRPEYEDLLLPKVTSAVELGESGPGFKDGYWDGLKQQYPAMFFAEDGAGTGDTSDSSGDGGKVPQTVTATGGIVQGVDPAKVLSGDVALTMG